MAGKAWTADEDTVIRESFGELLPVDIAKLLLGRTHKAVLNRAKALGLRLAPKEVGALNTKKFDAAVAERIGEPIADWLRRRYVDNQASYRDLCSEAGVNTRTLIRWMRESGITPVSYNEAALRQMARDPDTIKRMLTPDAQERRAESLARWRMENWRTYCTPGELALYWALSGRGFTPEPQFAVGSYNIDFAYPFGMLAVEYDPGWHQTKRRAERDAIRDAKLVALGWTVMRLDARTSIEFNVCRVSDWLIDWASTQPR